MNSKNLKGVNHNMENRIIKIDKHNFEISKNRLKKFSEHTKTDLELDKVRTGGDFLDVWSKGIFGFFNHSVTGKELNELTSQIQECLIDVNKTQIKIIKEFREVYNTFETLDKEYINGILLSIEGIKKTNERIEKNQKDIKKSQDDIEQMLETQKKTINAIIKFKKEVESYGFEEIKGNIEENKTDEDTELKLKKLKRTVLISNISFGIITILLFSLFFMGSK